MAPHFSDSAIDLEKNSFVEGIMEHPLFFDILSFFEIKSIEPWNENEKFCPALLENWKATEIEIALAFENRDRNKALKPMKEMILHFIAFLFWSNKKSVPSLINVTDELTELSILPVNAKERVNYLLTTPNHHHSFIQLRQLYTEQQKKFAVSKIKEKR